MRDSASWVSSTCYIKEEKKIQNHYLIELNNLLILKAKESPHALAVTLD